MKQNNKKRPFNKKDNKNHKKFKPKIPAIQLGSVSNGKSEKKTTDVTFNNVVNLASPNYTPDQPNNFEPIMPLNNQNINCQCLNLVKQGTGVSQRVGQEISMKTLRLNFHLVVDPVQASTKGTEYKLVVVYDKQPVGGVQASASYKPWLQIVGQQTYGNTTIATPQNLCDYSVLPKWFDRFIVLRTVRRYYPDNALVSINALGPTTQETFVIDEYIKLNGLKTVYNTSSDDPTIGDVQSGALLLYFMSNEDVANTTTYLAGTARLRFEDT